jgi:deazaflavin-dependent oxidoreductase (nitroreductase family)
MPSTCDDLVPRARHIGRRAGRLAGVSDPGSSPDQPLDSPRDWVNEHIGRYLATGGQDGHEWNGTSCLLLTYQGAESGTWRRTALIYGRHGDALALVASKGGAPSDPAWYRSLVAHPDARVQVMDEVFAVRARTADADERAAIWPVMTAQWPAYDEYVEKAKAAGREIQVVVLERA